MQLLVLAKEPVPGRVKTRLCPPLDAARRRRASAQAALEDTLDVVRAVPAERRVLVLDGRYDAPGFDVVPQRGGPMDERLAAAFDDCAGSPALLVGMDTPQLTAALLLAGGDRAAQPPGGARPVDRRRLVGARAAVARRRAAARRADEPGRHRRAAAAGAGRRRPAAVPAAGAAPTSTPPTTRGRSPRWRPAAGSRRRCASSWVDAVQHPHGFRYALGRLRRPDSPHRLAAQDSTLSRWLRGFESRWGHAARPSKAL